MTDENIQPMSRGRFRQEAMLRVLAALMVQSSHDEFDHLVASAILAADKLCEAMTVDEASGADAK